MTHSEYRSLPHDTRQAICRLILMAKVEGNDQLLDELLASVHVEYEESGGERLAKIRLGDGVHMQFPMPVEAG